MAWNAPCFMVTLDYFQKPPLEGRPNTNLGDHDTLNAHNVCSILFYHAWRPTWIEIHWISTWLRVPITYEFTLHLKVRDHTPWFWKCLDGLSILSFGLSKFHGHCSYFCFSSTTEWGTLFGGIQNERVTNFYLNYVGHYKFVIYAMLNSRAYTRMWKFWTINMNSLFNQSTFYLHDWVVRVRVVRLE